MNKDNKLIAEFMGLYEKHPLGNFSVNGGWWSESEFRYHLSWDWLMPVVETIGRNGFKFSIENNHCSIDGDETYFESKGANQTTLQATYEAVMAYINWYTYHRST